MTVRIGLLGSGFLSTFYMQGLQNVAGWEIPVVASPSIDHARAFAEKWNIPEATADVHGVIARKDLDLMLLAAPNYAHKDLVIRCAGPASTSFARSRWRGIGTRPARCSTPCKPQECCMAMAKPRCSAPR